MAGVPRNHRDPEVRSNLPDGLRGSRSRYLVAAPLVFAVGGPIAFVLAVGVMALIPGAAGVLLPLTMATLTLAGLAAFAMLAVGIRMDANLVAAADTDWAPDGDRQVRRAAVGVAAFFVLALVGTLLAGWVTGLFFGLLAGTVVTAPVAAGYLRSRRQHVGMA